MAGPASAVTANLGRARYAAAQGARVAWYLSHYLLARRLSGPFDRPGEPQFKPQTQGGDPTAIRKAFLDVFAQDRSNIEAGLYPAPNDLSVQNALAALRNSQRFFTDLPHIDARRINREGAEVRRSNETQGQYPSYYLQNFHYQSGGWLTRESAELYDTQVEVLFGGAADAMRRVALGEFARAMRGKDQRRVRALDIACGNGRFLVQKLSAFPRLKAAGLDLSPAYLEEARTRLAAWPQVDLIQGDAEHMPLEDASIHAATCVYLFHELPPKARRAIAYECARIIQPGGVLIFADSVQTNDAPALNQMLEYFPQGFHEPYYTSYLGENLTAIFEDAGFVLEDTKLAFLTKVLSLRRV